MDAVKATVTTDSESEGVTDPARPCNTNRQANKEEATPSNENMLTCRTKLPRKRITKREITISNCSDFLLYMATAKGGKAVRNVMIPELIKSLTEMSPSDSAVEACDKANSEISKLLMTTKDPENQTGQLPILESKMVKKFCIGKDFVVTNQVELP